MLQVQNDDKSQTLMIPTELNEYTASILTNITDNIVLAEHYSIIVLCYRIKLFDLIFSNKNKNSTLLVVPLLAKINESNCKYNVGEKLVVDRSSLERGNHIYIPFSNTYNNVLKFFQNNETLKTNLLSGKLTINNKNISNEQIYVCEFKIVPVNQITAAIQNKTITDPFIINGQINN